MVGGLDLDALSTLHIGVTCILRLDGLLLDRGTVAVDQLIMDRVNTRAPILGTIIGGDSVSTLSIEDLSIPTWLIRATG